MYIRYTYDEIEDELGEHRVELYETYDDFMGLVGDIQLKFVNSNYKEVLKEVKVYITEEALDTLKSLCKGKLTGVIKPDGKYLNF